MSDGKIALKFSFLDAWTKEAMRRIGVWSGAALLIFSSALCLAASRVELSQTEWQAVTLVKLLPYVRWPEQVQADFSSEFVVGVLGSDPVAGLLGELLKGTKVLGREVKVRVFESEPPAGRVQVLFVPARQAENWPEIARKLDPIGLLTVGVNSEFTKSGGVFSLRPQERQLVINLENARRADLAVDSKLLRICVKER